MLKSTSLKLAAAAVLLTGLTAQAQDAGALVEALVKKGILNDQRTAARSGGGFTVRWTDHYQGAEEQAEYQTVIIATGASARYQGLPGESEFLDGTGRKTGLTACATCDMVKLDFT